MNYIDTLQLKQEDNLYTVIIEIPAGTVCKYELNAPHNDKMIWVTDVLSAYPFCYGCFPQTLADDKDPLDAIILTSKAYQSGDFVKCKILGVIKTIDENEMDDKVVVCPYDEQFNFVEEKNSIIRFLKAYKRQADGSSIDEALYTEQEATRLISSANKSFEIDKQNREQINVNTRRIRPYGNV